MYMGVPSLVGEKGVALWKDGHRLVGEAAAAALQSGLQAAIGSIEKLGFC